MIVYADSSFVVSLYTYDANSPIAAKRMRVLAPPVLLSDLGEVEIINAMSLLLFQSEVNSSQASSALSLFQRDVSAGLFEIKPIPTLAFQRAKQITSKETPQLGTRTLDILHVCSALVFRAQLMLTFDRRQGKLASRLGLRLL